jgi:hypothetical protein
MVRFESNLNGDIVSTQEELYFVYDGPSFNGKMEIPSLIHQLRSTEILLNEVIKILQKERKIKEHDNIKLYLKLKRGSFQEIIQIILNHPMSVGIISGCIVVLFDRLLSKQKKSKCQINIENITNNITIVKEIDNIFYPLKDKKDKLIVYSPVKKEIKTEIEFNEKEILKGVIKKLEEEILVEIYEEEFFGYLYLINIDKGTMGFTLEGTNKHVPISFINPPSKEELKKVLFEKIKIKANATYRNKELSKIDIIEYNIKKRKNLFDYNGKDETT